MEQYKQEFIEFMVESDVLKFGEFTLKSGRKSPFFRNAGAYVTGSQLMRLGVDILGIQCIGQGVGQGLLAVVGGIVGVALSGCGKLINSRGDLLFAAKSHASEGGDFHPRDD